MPGSLLLGNDSYSDVSDVSGKSLDSKATGKKVSFNKAVRVKQYPWKPDFEVNPVEHLTLPSNRFWFKVYKNRNDTPDSNDYNVGAAKHSVWTDENMDCIHDSLAPIAEVEDHDVDLSPRHSNALSETKLYQHAVNGTNYGIANGNSGYQNRPTEPPVDYYDEERTENVNDRYWENNRSYGSRSNHSESQYNNYNRWNGVGKYSHETIKENDELISPIMEANKRLPFSNLNREISARRSLRRFDNSENCVARERRSRSHDDYMDNDRFQQHRKADKSVSTEDLNVDNRISPKYNFFKGSRDIATQCYGTLTGNKNPSVLRNSNHSSETQTESYISNTERLKNFKSQRSKLDLPGDYNNNNTTVSPKKDYSLEKLANLNRPQVNLTRTKNLQNQTPQNQKQYNMSNGNTKALLRTENSISSILQRTANETFGKLNAKTESKSPPLFTKKNEFNQNNNLKESSTVGYLRGRQIPLKEVNTNRKLVGTSKSNFGVNQQVSGAINGNRYQPLFPSRSLKSDSESTKGQSKRYLSPTNNHERRSFRIPSSPSKKYSSTFSEKSDSMIDWSLSGFQLAPKSDNGITSISDSEYTVHKREPLLMYIPGVSHHDRPAIEDDRLSALSDFSRSEINDDLSSLGGSHNRNGFGDFQRRQSLREGKSKWMKWRSKS